MQKINHHNTEKVIVVGCQIDEDEQTFERSMDELKSLVKSANGTVVATLTQKRQKKDSVTYIGKGKVDELILLIEEKDADSVVFNDELSSSQVRNIHLKTDVAIIDRTQLILDIFAQRAQSREGKLQVELAQLSYLLPRLAGQGLVLSRQGGGIGSKGPGETQLETDRRHIRKRMDEIKQQLEAVVNHRQRYRDRRSENEVLQLAIVGYTNAGKSTLLNRLAHSDTMEEDQLFATLDPTTRQMKLPSGLTVLLSDTVGFIQDLPTTLVAAFRSTLEELQHANLLLHVVDCSNNDYEQHERTVNQLIEQLGAESIPQLLIYNKAENQVEDFFPNRSESSVEMSAYNEDDVSQLKKVLEKKLSEQLSPYEVFLKPNEGRLLSKCKQDTLLLSSVWDGENEVYHVKGRVISESSIGQQLLTRMKEEE